MTAAARVETRFLPRSQEAARMSTEELRQAFLVDRLFAPGEMRLVYTDLDRMIVGGVVPREEMRLNGSRELGTAYFTERREVGVINLGGLGTVRVGGKAFELERLDCLYIGCGEEDVRFEPGPKEAPAFYILSCPAHRRLPTAKVARGEAEVQEVGDPARASRRRISRCIHPGGTASCQLVMGFTELEQGSVWNTMPPHTHGRRSEVYLYFDLGDDVVVHLMGPPQSTRHLIMRNQEAVLSPPWSIHAGAGTGNYRFVWGMAGENMTFSDMDGVTTEGLM